MKKKFIWVLALVLLVVGSFGDLFADEKKPRFYIKLTGNGSFSSAGDFGDFITRKEAFFADFATDSRYTVTLTKQPFFRGFGGEMGIEVKKHAVGISAGYMAKKFTVDYHYAADNSNYESTYLWEYEFSAVPIFLFIHYKVVDSRFIKAFLTLGEGVYLATYRDNRAATFENAQLTFINSGIRARKAQLGFHAGISVDFNISRNLALSLDAGYRLSKFENMNATGSYEDDNQDVPLEGVLHYKYFNVEGETGDTEFGIDASNPPRNKWEDLPAVLNLNGFSVSMGLKIIF